MGVNSSSSSSRSRRSRVGRRLVVGTDLLEESSNNFYPPQHHAITTVHVENDWNVAHVRVHTHTALRPSDFPDESLEARAHPGITLRDVRFAYALENLLESIP